MAQVMTVNGPISPDELGVTMCHLHLLSQLLISSNQVEQKDLRETQLSISDAVLASKPVTMDMLGPIRRNIFLVKDNLILGDVDELADELMLYKRMGGGSVVECSVQGLLPDPVGLKKISGATGVNVICSTGFYINATHPDWVKESSINELCDYMVRELTVGIDNTGIKAGIIKLALSSPDPEAPYSGSEEKVLRAAARAQAESGAPMTIHPCHHQGRAKHWHTYLDILQEEGANLEKFYTSHIERYYKDIEYTKSVLDRGVTIGYDQFGNDYYMSPGKAYTPDLSRVEGVVELVKSGYAKQIVLSNEIVFKCSLRKYGGHGYAHVLENIVPDLRFHGVTEEQLNAMLVENPKRLLPF